MKNSFFSKSVKQLLLVSLLFVVSTTSAQWKEQTTGGSTGYRNAVRYNSTGELYTLLQDASNGYKATVQKQTGATWSIVGTAGFSTYMVYEPTMAVNQANGDLFVAYIESISGVYKLSCNKFNGTSWVDVGTPEFLTTGGTGKPGMTIDNNGNPVIVTPFFGGFYVYQYDGTNWNNLTAGATQNYNSTTPLDIVFTWGDHGGESKNNYFPFADSNGDIYVAVSSAGLSNNGVGVFKYAAGTWTKLGANLPGGSDSAFQRVLKAPDGTLYVAYSQTSTFNQICKIYVHKWNGSSWVDITNVGTQIFNSTYSNFNNFSFDIAFDSNSIPLVIYQNTGIDNRAYVKKYNSSTSSWDMARSGQVGGFYLEAGVRLFIDNAGLPYYVGTSGAEPKVYVIENKPVFNSTSFLPISGIVGSTVNIYGGNFTGTTSVSFNGTAATFTVNSNTLITVTVPANATTGPISVTNAAGTSATSSNYTVVFPKPIITSFSPIVATTGNTLTLNGLGFSSVLNDNVVYISGIKCTLLSATTTSITLTVPPGISTGKINYTNKASNYSTISDEDLIAKFSYPSGYTSLSAGNYIGNGSVVVATDNSLTGNTDRFSISDFNEDQKPDIIMYAGKVNLKYFTNGTSSGNTFQATNMASSDLFTSTITSGTGSHALLGDYDGDGDLDIFGVVSGYSGSNWFKNASSGGTVSVNAIGDVTNTVFGQGLNTIDINRDGKLDWIGVYDSGNPLAYTQYLNSTASVSSNFSFTSSGSQTITNVKKVTRVADLDGNGYQDLIVGYTSGLKIRPNINGVLTAASDLNISTTTTPFDIRVVDLDLDGKKDIITTAGSGTSPSLMTVIRNTSISGALSFATPATYSTGGNFTYGIAVTDVNNDDLPDVLVGCSNKLVLFINNSTNGNISFLAAQDLGAAAANLSSLIALDINADGAMDIVGLTADGLNLKYFIFSPPPAFSVTSNLGSFSKCGSTATPQTFSVTGSNLTNNIVLAALTGYEYSLDGSTYSSTLTITPSSGSVPSTTVYVRLTAASTGTPTGNISISSTNATTVTVAVAGSVNANTAISVQPSTTVVTVCQGATITALSITATGGNLTYQWYSNSTASTSGATAITGATSASYTPVNSVASALYYYCVVTGACGTVTSNISGLITVSVTPVAGTASASETSICSGSTSTLSLTGNTGTIQWQQSSTVNGTYTNIVSATSASYTTPALTATTYYRAVVSSGVCTAVNSNVITINIVQPENAGVSGSIAICPGTTITSQELISVINPTLSLTSNLGGTGGTGNGFFMSIDAVSDVVIKSFNVSLTATTPWVRVYYKTGSWTSFTTNAGAWILAGQANNLTSGGSVPLNLDLGIVLNQGQTYSFYVVSSSQVLSYAANVASTSTIAVQDSYLKMYGGTGQFGVFAGTTYSPRSFVGTIIYSVGITPFNPNGTWSPTIAGAGTYTYTVQPTSPCTVPSTSTVTVTNLATPAAPTVANTSVSYCQNATATALTATASTSHTLRWYTVSTGGTGSTTAITPVTTSTGTITYYVAQVNASGCEGPRVAITVTVSPTSVAGTATGTATICSGTTTTVSLTGNTGSIQWQSSLNNSTWTPITGAIAANFTSPALNATTYYRAVVTSGGCTAVNSNVITITVPPAPYPYDRAVNFSNGGHLTKAAGASINLSNWTVEAWIYPTAWNYLAGIISKRDFQFMTNSNGALSIMIERDWSWELTTTSNNVVTLNKWQHVAASYNASTKVVKIYVNGLLVHTFTRTQFFVPDFNSFDLKVGYNNGQGNGTPSRTFAGNIDEVKIWNTVRTDAEINTNFVAELAGNESGLVAYYKFDQGVGGSNNTAITSITDLTANANHLTPASSSPVYAMNGTTNNILQVGPAILSSPSICVNSTLTLIHTLSGGTWSTSDSTIISVNPNTGAASADAVGTATITYTFTDNGCTYTTTKLFTVNALPVAPVATTAVNLCQGAIATALTATALTGNTLQWYSVQTGGSASTTALSPTTNALGQSIYYVSQRNNSTGCEGARTAITVNVNANPTITGVQSITVGGSTLQLTGSGTPDATTPWSSSSTAIATVSSTGVVTAVAGGNVTITYTNASGCSITAALRVVDCAQPFGNALAFGVGTTAANADFVQVNSRIFPSQTLSNFTIETWIRPSASDIMTGTTGNNWLAFLGYTGTKRSPSLYITNNGVLHASWQEGIGLNGTPVSASSPTSLVQDKWAHVALVKEGTTMRLYVNAIQVYSVTCAATIDATDNFYWLGKSDNQFNGTLDEVRFWSIARSQSDILAAMNTELAGNETGLLTYFDFNQGVAGGTNTSITTVTNKANSALNGTLNNFTRTGTSSNFVGNATANIDIAGAATICGNSTTQYTHQIPGGTWTVSNGATATISTTGLLTSTVNENITVSYAYTLNGCSFTATRAVAINSPAGPVTNTTINLCQGATTSALTATALSGHTLQWYTLATGGTASATAPIPSASTAGTTTYYVSQKNNTTNCESARTAITVTVNAVPTISGAQSMTVGGNTLQLTGSGTAATTNPWVSSTTGIATISNTGEVTAVGAGSSIITYTVTTGCTATAVISVVDCSQPFGNALQFDGVNDSFSTASNLSALNITGNISIETWIKFDQVHSDYVRIIGKGDSGNRTYGLWLGTNGKLLFQIWGSFGSGLNLESITALQPGVWYHISATRNGNIAKIYINGVEDATTTITVTPQTNSLPLTVGYGNMHTWLKGALDEVRIWNVARTLSQIQQGMYNALVGNESGLVAYYDFNQGIAGGDNSAVNSVLDRTTNVLHGTLTNFAKTGTASNFVGNTLANFAITGAETVCANSTSQYTHLIPGGTWSVSNGAAASVSATGLLTTVGTESVTLTYNYTLNGCSKSATKSISIVAPSIPVQPSTTAQNVCINGTTASLSITATNINTTYQWYKNATASNTGGTLISGATTSGYTPLSNVAGTTYYYCTIGGTCSPNISSTVSGAVIISPNSVAGTITGTATICSGTTTTLNLAGNVGTIQWQQLDNSTWTDIAGATSTAFTTPALTQSTSYRAVVRSGSCTAVNTSSYNLVVNNAPVITTQPSTLTQNVCLNGITSSLSVSATGAGLTYQWYKNTTATTTGGTLISGATFSVYMPSNNLSGTTYYYCIVSGTCSPAVTSDVSGAINISPTSVAGNILGATSVCTGTNSTVLTLSGNVGAIQWQSSTNNVTFINIAGETSSTYTATNLTSTTYYRAAVTSGSCAAINTATIIITATPLPVISGNTSVGLGDAITLSATTTAASSNAWVSSSPSVASVSNTGVVNGLSIGTTTITYTNSIGCTDTEIITVVGGTTQIPILTLPATNTSGATTLNFNYTLPETPLAGSVRLIITPSAGGTAIIWNMNNATSASFSYLVGSNPTSISNVVSGTSLSYTTYNITLVYQDAFGNPAASVTNTNIQTLAPPVISFANANYNGIINQPISIQTVNTGGGMVTYTITPALPAGLSLNAATGLISGTPTVTLSATTFTVTATNAAGTDTESFILFIDADTDGDGIGNATDPDIDGDGTLNGLDTNPTNPCLGFNANTASASWQTGDCDGDGIPNGSDADIDGNGTTDNGSDTDGDGINDASDTDIDGDGILNGVDNCPTIVNTSIVTQPSTQNVNSCLSTVPFALTVAAAGQQLTYQWYSNTSNSNSGGTVISGATTASYIPTTSYVSRYYYVVVSGTCGTVTSNVSGAITINPISVAGSIAGAASVCSGTNSTVLTLSGNTGTIQWQSSSDNISFTTITGATASTFTATNLTATTYYRAVVTSGVCSSATTASVTITVSPTSVAGSIAGATSVCSGTNSTVLTLSGNTGTIQWQSSTDNITFTTIAGATASTYTASNITATTYYRAVVTSGVCSSATTASVTITVSPTSLPGSIAGATSVCSGTNSTVLTLSGNTGTIQWQWSTDNVTFFNIPSATTSTYSATNISVTTYYRAVVTSGVCSSATTTVSTITVNPISVAGSISGAATVCSGTNSTVLTLSGNTGTIQWQSSTNNVTFTSITGANASTYTATNLTATTYYRAVVTSGVCSSATTASVTITVNPTSVAGSIAGATTVCSGTNATVLTLSGNIGTIQWQSSTDNVTFTNIASATASTFTATNLTATTYYRAVVTSGVCSSATTASVTITVNPISVAGSIAGAATVCSGTNSTVLTLSGNTGTIQWQSSTNNVTFTTITGATASTFTATNLTATTYYRAVVTSGVCSSATTASITITVNPTSVAGSIAGATTVCSATNSTVLTLSGNTGTIQWQSSTDNVTFTNIASATASTYTATNISATTYYRAVVTSGVCSSATTAVAAITYIPIVAPTAVSNQQFCYLNNPTVSNLVTTSGVGIKWYATATGGIPLTGSTPLTTGTTYYASQTISVCESPTRVVVTVILTCPVDAIADNFGSINGYAGATTASVLANDTINGGLLLPSQVILTGITVPTGLTLNANGTITIAPQTAAGTYNVTYRICELLNPTNCDTVTFSIVVGACLDFAINDCDLDGESNGTEVANGTNPSDACSYTNAPASNIVVYPTWSVLDCDGDGVINGQEITDGTNPINPCSSNPINITLPLSTSFLNGDCDNDGLLNGEEIGSNVSYPNDSNGNGIPDYLEVNNHTVSEDNLEVYSSLTPNGDGNNDVFIIRNIENYPENNVSIFNRWGITVYDVDGYGQDNKYFKGISEGRITINSQDELPIGTYFYIIKYKNNNGEQKQRSGYLYINR